MQPFYYINELGDVFLNGETLLKRVFKQDKQIILQSENNEFPPKIVNSEDNLRIIGNSNVWNESGEFKGNLSHMIW
ncbi:LexA family protein [Macrococcoides caseolyticum]|uniref:LexA family protein n=1 Tax=Macrococcoides caseolyticum TaxID=69966 RepID=UPI0039C96778